MMPRFDSTRNLLVRAASSEDADATRAIYNHFVETTTVTFDLVPRTLEEQRSWLANRSGAHAVLVAELDRRVVGFASLSPFKDRPAYSTTVEDSVYVDPNLHRMGVGRTLLAEIVELARLHGFHSVMARIVGGHDASVALHSALGFETVGVEREVGRKFGRWLDVIEMQLLL